MRHKLAIVTLLYVLEGFPMGVYMDVFPVFLRRHDVSLGSIGVLSAFSFAWALKVLWSPLVDRFGERRLWISGAQLALGGALCVLALGGDPTTLGLWLWLGVGLYCLASATQDIAIDAYTIGLVDRGDEGPVNAVRSVAYRIGLIAAGGALLLLPRHVGWSGTFAAATALALAMAASVALCPRVAVPEAARRDTWGSLRRFAERPDVWQLAAFILLYRIGDRAMGPMVKPFWVDRGFSNEEIALLANTVGTLATVAGAVVGGLGVKRFGIGPSLWGVGALALLSNLAYAGAALPAEPLRPAVYAASIVESFCSGLAGVAFMSLLMRLCDKDHAAVQYAALTALYALTGSAVGIPSGFLTESIGYASYFALTALFALPAFAFLPTAARAARAREDAS